MRKDKNNLPKGYKMTELGPLPEEWQVVRLGEVASVLAGGTAPQGSQYFGGPHPFVRVQHLDEDCYYVNRWDLITDEAIKKYRLKLFQKGTILFPKSGASIRLEKRAMLSRPSYLVSHLCAVVPNKHVNHDFLFYALKDKRLSAEKAEGYPTLSLTEIKQTLIHLPPLPEQRAIAQVLRTVQKAKETTERVIVALRELKKSLMRHLFTFGPVPVENVGATDRSLLKETEIGPIPEHWQVVRFSKAIKGIARVPKVHQSDYRPIGRIPIIDQGQKFISGFTDDLEPYCTNLPVIVFGDHTRIMKFVDFPFVVGADGTKVLLPNIDCFEPLFFYYALLNLELTNRGYNRHFHLLREKQIPLPPLAEQQEIARILQAVDKRIEAEEGYRKSLEALFKTLLHELMTGKRRVRANDVLPQKEDAI